MSFSYERKALAEKMLTSYKRPSAKLFHFIAVDDQSQTLKPVLDSDAKIKQAKRFFWKPK